MRTYICAYNIYIYIVCIHRCMYVCVYTHAGAYKQIYRIWRVYIYIYLYTCEMCIYIIYIYTYIFTL